MLRQLKDLMFNNAENTEKERIIQNQLKTHAAWLTWKINGKKNNTQYHLILHKCDVYFINPGEQKSFHKEF